MTAAEISASPANGGQVSSTARPDANGYYTLAKVPPNQAYISVRDESGQRLYMEQYWNGTRALTPTPPPPSRRGCQVDQRELRDEQ